jgi:hypothetical protein
MQERQRKRGKKFYKIGARKLKKKSDRGALTTLAGFKSTANLPDAILASFEAPNNFGNVPASIPGSAMSPNRVLGLQATRCQCFEKNLFRH